MTTLLQISSCRHWYILPICRVNGNSPLDSAPPVLPPEAPVTVLLSWFSRDILEMSAPDDVEELPAAEDVIDKLGLAASEKGTKGGTSKLRPYVRLELMHISSKAFSMLESLSRNSSAFARMTF